MLHATRLPRFVAGVAAWAGLAVIVTTAVRFDLATRFPGPAALVPVCATAAVILGGPLLGRGPIGLLNLRPMTWVGQRSYSIYLWHWPALVLVEAELGPLAAWERVVTLLASVVIAAVTYRILENPMRHWRWLAARGPPRPADGQRARHRVRLYCVAVFATTPASRWHRNGRRSGGRHRRRRDADHRGGAGPSPARSPVTPPRRSRRRVAGDGPGGSATSSAPVTSSAPATTAPPTTVRPSSDELAVLNEPQLLAGLLTEASPANLRPSLRGARGDLPGIYNDGCHLDAAVTTPGPCTFGDPTSTTTVALFGDSHAAQSFPALAQLADQHRWRLLVLTKKGCPTASISVFSPMVNRELRECDAWRINVAARLAAEQPDLLLMSSYRYRQTGAWAGVDGNEAWQQGLSATLAAYRPLARRVLVLGDTPTPARDIPACVSRT